MVHTVLSFFLLFVALTFAGAEPLQVDSKPNPSFKSKVVSPKEIEALKKKPCTLIYVWAAWCLPCVQELPQVLQMLRRRVEVHPVVLDISNDFSQKNFSIKWMEESLKPPFLTFRRKVGPVQPFVKAVDSRWNGNLPYSVLYNGAKKLNSWLGSKRDLQVFERELVKFCNKQ